MAEESVLSSQEYGSGVPILFIHGWQMDGNAEVYDFESIFSSMSDFYRIYIDLPAMGTTPSYGVQDLHDIYRHVDRFIAQRFGSTSSFLLVGSSCGAYLARALAGKYARQVDGLLLRVPLIHPNDLIRDVDPFQPLVRSEEALADASPTLAEEELLDPILIKTPAYVTAFREKSAKAYRPAVRRADNKVLDVIRQDPLRYRLPSAFDETLKQKFFSPTLIIAGRHDTDVGYRDSLELTELYPRSTYVVLDRGTHALPIDERGLFDALVRDWLYRVREWRSQPSH